jgi:hypothetical protein
MSSRFKSRNVQTLSIGGQNVLALWRTGSIRITRAIIDGSAVNDGFTVRDDGKYDWEVRCGKVIETARVFPALILAGSSIPFTSKEASTGKTYSGNVRIPDVEIDLGGVDQVQLESITLQGDGALLVDGVEITQLGL